jgi:drug/metabolite transporter (DMT)-like permease
MNWIFLVVGAQFLNALVALIDKRIVTDERILPQPFVYAFYTCLISGGWIAIYLINLLPLPLDQFGIPSFRNVVRPTLEVVALSFLAAYTFFTALTTMFSALREHDASDVIPVIGSVSAIASYGLGYFFLSERLTPNFLIGVLILAVGTALVSRFRFTVSTAFMAVYSGVFFAFHYIAIKGLFNTTSFDDGFFWSRVAFVFFALTLLMIPTYFKRVKTQTKTITAPAYGFIFASKILAGVSTLLILHATNMGDVAVVQALGGLQYVFIIMLGILFTLLPGHAHVERYERSHILQKVLFITVIATGFLVLFI